MIRRDGIVWSRVILPLFCLGLGSCASNDPVAPSPPPRWRGYSSIDGYASSSSVRLYWSTATSTRCWDFPCPPPGPPIAKVLLERSVNGIFGGWQVVAVRDTGGIDSATVNGLLDGALYRFRVVAFDKEGRPLLASNPIMTVPGRPTVPSVSAPVEINGRFSWSPSGDSIAFVDASTFGEKSISLLDTRSLVIDHLVTYSGDEWIEDAIWSRDGTSIAYTHTPTQTFGGIDYRVWTTRLPPDTAEIQTSGRVDFDPAWGGSGWIYFCRGTYEPPNIAEVWRVKPDEISSLQSITADPSVNKASLSIRPSDDCVVYGGSPVKGNLASGLFLVRPGGFPMALTRADWYTDMEPSWNPDGQHVVFVSKRSGHWEVWSVDARTGALGQLTRSQRESPGTMKLSPCWSPNGTRLAVFDGQGAGNSVRGRLEIYDGIVAAP